MSKYIDKDELWERLRKHMVHHIVTNTLFNTIKAVIDGMPTIEVSEDCISKEPNGVWKAKSFHECFCDNCGFIFDIMKCDFLENMKFCPNCGAKMKGADDE